MRLLRNRNFKATAKDTSTSGFFFSKEIFLFLKSLMGHLLQLSLLTEDNFKIEGLENSVAILLDLQMIPVQETLQETTPRE